MTPHVLQPSSNWEIPKKLPDLSQYPVIAVDLETYDPNIKTKGPGWCRNDGLVAGVAIAAGNNQWYFPIGHKNGMNWPLSDVKPWLQEVLKYTKTVVMFNAIYDLGWLRWMGVEVKGNIYDPMLAMALIDEHRKEYNLDSVGRDLLGSRKDMALLQQAALAWGLKDPYSGMHILPPQFVGPYAEQDAALTLELYQKTQDLIYEDDLEEIYALELKQLPIILDMRSKGVRVDVEKAEALGKTLIGKENDLLELIKRHTSMDVDIWSNLSIQKAFESLTIPYNRTAKGNPSFTAQWLEENEHPVSQAIVQCRRYNRARSTFSSGLITDHAVNGRIHCQFNQLKGDEYGTISGRYSSSTPNLQQIPARDPEIGPLIRSLFQPDDGLSWCKADYSQQEPRLTVHYASLLGLPESNNAVEYYRGCISPDYHQMIADMAGIERSKAKTINLGLAYGMGQAKLADKLGLTQEEGKILFDKYHAKVPFVRALSDACKKKADEYGFIRTLLHRKCRFKKWQPYDRELQKKIPPQDDKNYLRAIMKEEMKKGEYKSGIARAFTYRAMNRLIQGSAADMTKKALVEVYNAGFTPHLQVHDELDFSIETEKEAQQIKEIMENCVTLEVPVKVDIGIGENWGCVK